LFECTRTGQFADVARPLGCDAIEDARGVAIADLNNDGLLDIVSNNNNAPPTIYLNRLAHAGNWLRVQLNAGPKGNRDAVGARIQVLLETDGKQKKMTRWVEAGTGYAAQSEMVSHFGLGRAKRIDSLRITWPGGSREEFGIGDLAGRVNTTIRIEQGGGISDAAKGVLANAATGGE
jgi:hypothetical protein